MRKTKFFTILFIILSTFYSLKAVEYKVTISLIDESIQANVIGGFEPYTYLWSNGETTQIITPGIAGEYTIVVTDETLAEVQATINFTGPQYVDPSAAYNFDFNFVKTETALIEGVNSESVLYYLNEDSKSVSYSYVDGLGRQLQTVAVKASPAKNDIVQHFEYDDYGRQVQEYLPYTVDSEYGAFRENANSEQSDYYDITLNITPNIAFSDFPYAEKVFDNSPLNRVMEQGAPGADWQPQDASITNSGHTIETNYLSNIDTEYIFSWSVTEDGTCEQGFPYASNTLFKTEIIDENGISVLEYTDLSGKTICKISNDGTDDLFTYYVYDDFDRLRYVFPPEMVGVNGTHSPITSSDYDELIYYYEYDHKGRMIKKKIPGAQEILMVYDNRDRLVLAQDGNLEDNDKWSFTKYDMWDRPVMTGIVQLTGSSRDQLATDFEAHTVHFENIDLAQANGYTLNNSYPMVISADDLLTVTYYDNYNYQTLSNYPDLSFDDVNNIDTYIDNDANINGYYDNIKGQVAGTKILVLDNSATPNWLYSANYYDDKGRIIQAVSTNYTGGFDIISSQYDFTGTILATRHEQSVDFGTETIIVEYSYNTYDHAGRLLKTEHQIGDDPLKREILTELAYNENGQLIEKNIAGNESGEEFQQSIDYTYNIRGWMTGINDPESPQTVDAGDDYADLFDMKFYYNDVVAELGQTADNKLYNGNIAGVKWAHYGDDVEAYAYTYDEINRIKSADYGDNNVTDPWNNTEYELTGRNTEPSVVYDKNGNILSLGRSDEAGNWLNNLHYRYNGNKLMALSMDGTDVSATVDNYDYDDNGNMILDNIKGLSVNYNILNLPQEVNYGSGNYINYIYDATGRKLAQDIYVASSLTRTTDYAGNIIYKDGAFQYLLTGEGRVNKPNTEYIYEYHIKDHLGSTRVAFESQVAGPTVTQNTDYYPFGLRFTGNSNNDNKYLYNGKELQDGINLDADDDIELPLNWYDYGARMYDATLGRFSCIDPIAEKFAHVSPFNYAENRPIDGIDLWGLQWMSVIDNQGNYNISVNVNFVLDFNANILPLGATVSDYQTAISTQFNKVLQASSENYSGSITFNGGESNQIGQIVPTIRIANDFADNIFGGWATFQHTDVNIYNSNGGLKTPSEVAGSAVHELFHTVRIEHPFDKTQSADTKLLHGEGDNYFSTSSTDPNIYYNIMNYGLISIDNQNLGNLWQTHSSMYLTNGQLNLMLNEINLQQQGYGLFGEGYNNYWLNTPGTDVP